MRVPMRLCLAPIMLALLAGNVSAQNDDRAAVLALMDRAFDAVSSGKADDWRAIQLAGGTSISFRARPDGAPGELEMRMATNEAEAVASTAGNETHKDMERWTGEPTVMIRGPIAVVWGEYEYFIDGVFSHCGVDSADLVKVDGEWKLANWMWTVEKEGCPTDPSTTDADPGN